MSRMMLFVPVGSLLGHRGSPQVVGSGDALDQQGGHDTSGESVAIRQATDALGVLQFSPLPDKFAVR